MYLEHFGLREEPFPGTPDCGVFFTGARRGEMLDALAQIVTHGDGPAWVCGEAGSGKTMLCRMLLERLAAQADTVFIASHSLSPVDLQAVLAEEFRVPGQVAGDPLPALKTRLVEIHLGGRRAVLLIDEAQALSAETLAAIGELAKLEIGQQQLLTIVLFSGPALEQRFHQPELRGLREGIRHKFELEALDRDDVSAYLMFRLRAAGYRGADLFTPAASQSIADAAHGSIGKIHRLADRALQASCDLGGRLVDLRELRQVTDGERVSPPSGLAVLSPARSALAARVGIGLLVLLVGGILLFHDWSGSATDAQPLASAPAAAAAANAAASSQAAVPADGSAREAANAGAPAASTLASPLPQPAAEPVSVPAAARGHGAIGGSTARPAPTRLTLEERIAGSEEWIRQLPDSHYFIQLVRTSAGDRATAEAVFADALRKLDPAQLHAYRSALSGRERIGVIYGDYATAGEARKALAGLPPLVWGIRPYVRQVRQLR